MKAKILFCLQSFPQSLDKCLAYNRSSKNNWWMYEINKIGLKKETELNNSLILVSYQSHQPNFLNSFSKLPQKFWSNARGKKTSAIQRTCPKFTKIMEKENISPNTFPLSKAALSQSLPHFHSGMGRSQVQAGLQGGRCVRKHTPPVQRC